MSKSQSATRSLTLHELPPEILEKIFFLLSPSSLELLKEAAGSEIPAHFSRSLEFVIKTQRDYAALRRSIPASVDTAQRLFPEKLRFREDAENLFAIVNDLTSRVERGEWEEKKVVLDLDRDPESVRCVFKFDAVTCDVALSYIFSRAKSAVKIYPTKDGSLSQPKEFQVDRLAAPGSFFVRRRRFVWLSQQKDAIAGCMRICYRDVDFGGEGSPPVTETPIHGHHGILKGGLVVSDSFAVVRDTHQIFVFHFPSLRFAYKKNWATQGFQIVGRSLYVLENRDLVVWDLGEGRMRRRLTWKRSGIETANLKWPYLYGDGNEGVAFAVLDGEDESARSVEWNPVVNNPFFMMQEKIGQSEGISDWILTHPDYQFTDLCEVQTGENLKQFRIKEMEKSEGPVRVILHDFQFFMITHCIDTSRLAIYSFVLK